MFVTTRDKNKIQFNLEGDSDFLTKAVTEYSEDSYYNLAK